MQVPTRCQPVSFFLSFSPSSNSLRRSTSQSPLQQTQARRSRTQTQFYLRSLFPCSATAYLPHETSNSMYRPPSSPLRPNRGTVPPAYEESPEDTESAHEADIHLHRLSHMVLQSLQFTDISDLSVAAESAEAWSTLGSAAPMNSNSASCETPCSVHSEGDSEAEVQAPTSDA